ncbi:hypothetical protein [Clostridium butyricum]|uniref:hypothetical protein n=1 Tax=Clostridium butyricum TaxID=1492 RepID=UPI00374EFEDC
MIYTKTIDSLKSELIKENKDLLKTYFEKRDAQCTINENCYTYTYNDTFHNKAINVICDFSFDDKNTLLKLSIDCNENESKYEIDDYCNNVLASISLLLFSGKNKYIVRIYSKYYSQYDLDLESVFKFKYKINLIPYPVPNREEYYNVDQLTSCPKEHILFFDIEIDAFNVSAARSLAYNCFLEFSSMLAVLLDLGIEAYTTEENLLLLDLPANGNRINFTGTLGSHGIDDQELDLLVFDNMNGLIAVKDDGTLIVSKYLSFSYGNTTITTSHYNEKLENIFKNRTLKTIKKSYPNERINNDITFYTTQPQIVSDHISFFRKINQLKENDYKKYTYFLNACKMYNNALSICANNPTMMISYLVASIETLSKTNDKSYYKECSSDMEKFLLFCNSYSDENLFDKDFFKYIYGSIRSGHFHSGEFKFEEYNCNLDQSLNKVFFENQNKFLRAKRVLRNIIINWININILNIKNTSEN